MRLLQQQYILYKPGYLAIIMEGENGKLVEQRTDSYTIMGLIELQPVQYNGRHFPSLDKRCTT